MPGMPSVLWSKIQWTLATHQAPLAFRFGRRTLWGGELCVAIFVAVVKHQAGTRRPVH